MKPYFVKYLPVEGEIEEGDWVLASNEKIGTRLAQAISIHGNVHKYDFVDEDLKKDVYYEEFQFWNKGYSKKVKLFLCSRDIEVDDKLKFKLDKNAKWMDVTLKEVYELNGIQVPIVKYEGQTTIVHTTFDDCLIKVIGEISLEATWVKEGDEFGEDEVRILGYYNSPWDLAGFTVSKVKIKGPCGHFH